MRIEWAEIREIVAYKEDCFSYDEICIGFRVTDTDAYPRVTEDFLGYKELMEKLKMRFPDIRTDWFRHVAFPAFVPKWTVIWGTPLPPERRVAESKG